jgi:hypothetical protein
LVLLTLRVEQERRGGGETSGAAAPGDKIGGKMSIIGNI